MVMDNGCGMDAGTLEAVLSDGVRASDSEGHGLGLGIVQALCEAQGMGFSLVSRVGVGTRAVIEIGGGRAASPTGDRSGLVNNG